jgi:hypothetical protein
MAHIYKELDEINYSYAKPLQSITKQVTKDYPWKMNVKLDDEMYDKLQKWVGDKKVRIIKGILDNKDKEMVSGKKPYVELSPEERNKVMTQEISDAVS